MGMTDPIADMLTRIRNAILARHETVDIPYSKMKEKIIKKLKENGFIRDYSVIQGKSWNIITVELKYLPNRSNVITKLERVSKPGRRVYVSLDNMPRIKNGRGIAIISTSKDILTDREARELHVGGEWICSIW